MINEAVLNYLKAAIEKNTIQLHSATEVNYILSISNSLLSGVITKETALSDPVYASFIESLNSKNKKNEKMR